MLGIYSGSNAVRTDSLSEQGIWTVMAASYRRATQTAMRRRRTARAISEPAAAGAYTYPA